MDMNKILETAGKTLAKASIYVQEHKLTFFGFMFLLGIIKGQDDLIKEYRKANKVGGEVMLAAASYIEEQEAKIDKLEQENDILRIS